MRFLSVFSMAGFVFLGLQTNAQAKVFKCTDVERPDTAYLLALTVDSGILYKNDSGYFSAEEGEVQVSRAEDGGPVSVSFSPKDPVVDWEDYPRRCWLRVESNLSFSIRVSSAGDGGSTVQMLPNFMRNPFIREECSVPRPRPSRRFPISCELL